MLKKNKNSDIIPSLNSLNYGVPMNNHTQIFSKLFPNWTIIKSKNGNYTCKINDLVVSAISSNVPYSKIHRNLSGLFLERFYFNNISDFQYLNRIISHLDIHSSILPIQYSLHRSKVYINKNTTTETKSPFFSVLLDLRFTIINIVYIPDVESTKEKIRKKEAFHKHIITSSNIDFLLNQIDTIIEDEFFPKISDLRGLDFSKEEYKDLFILKDMEFA